MKIKARLILSFSLMVFAAVLVVSAPIILRQVKIQQENLTENARYMERVFYTEVENFLKEPKGVLDAMSEYARTQELDREVITPFLQGLAETNSDYQYVYYVDAVPYSQGGFLADNLHLDIPGDYDQTTRGWFKAAAASDGFIVTEPYMDIMVGGVVITLAKRVMKDGRFFGVAAVDIALDRVVKFANSFRMTAGGSSYILSADGKYITNADSEKVLKADFFDDYGFSKYRKELSSSSGFANLDAGGGNYLIGSKLPEVTGWLFASAGPSGELYGAIYSNTRFALFLALACILAAVAISLLISNMIVRPLNEVVVAVKGIAEGNADLTYRLPEKCATRSAFWCATSMPLWKNSSQSYPRSSRQRNLSLAQGSR